MGKHCSKCKEYKSYSEFHRDSRSGDGYRSDCILCRFKKHKYRKYRNSRYSKQGHRQLHSRIFESTYDKLNYMAEVLDISKSVIIEAALKQYFERHLARATAEGIKQGRKVDLSSMLRERDTA